MDQPSCFTRTIAKVWYKHIRLSTKWKHKKNTLLGHIIRAESEDPMREVLFETGTFRPRVEHIRRVGKPRANWLTSTTFNKFKPFMVKRNAEKLRLPHHKVADIGLQILRGVTSIEYFIEYFNAFISKLFSSNKSNHHVPVCTHFYLFHILLHDWLRSIRVHLNVNPLLYRLCGCWRLQSPPIFTQCWATLSADDRCSVS